MNCRTFSPNPGTPGKSHHHQILGLAWPRTMWSSLDSLVTCPLTHFLSHRLTHPLTDWLTHLLIHSPFRLLTHIFVWYQSKLQVFCLTNVTGAIRIAGLEWYNGLYGYMEPNCPSLALCFDNGRCQIMRSEIDESEWFLITSGICVLLVNWMILCREWRMQACQCACVHTHIHAHTNLVTYTCTLSVCILFCRCIVSSSLLKMVTDFDRWMGHTMSNTFKRFSLIWRRQSSHQRPHHGVCHRPHPDRHRDAGGADCMESHRRHFGCGRIPACSGAGQRGERGAVLHTARWGNCWVWYGTFLRIKQNKKIATVFRHGYSLEQMWRRAYNS